MKLTIRQFGVAVLLSFFSCTAVWVPASAADEVSSLDTEQAELTALLHYFLANSSTEAAHAKLDRKSVV